MKKRIISMMLATAMVVGLLAGCGASSDSSDSSSDTADTADTSEDTSDDSTSSYPSEAVVIIEGSAIANGTWNLEYLESVFPDTTFVSKQFDNTTIATTIKTAYTANESVDISIYWPTQMATFVDSDMALDLTPYLEADPEWAATFKDGMLEQGTYDGSVYAIPDSIVFPSIIANSAILEEAGVEIGDSWTWDEFLDACAKIEENTDAFPMGVQSSRSCWFVRIGLLQIWDSQEELDSWNAGEISCYDDKVYEVFNNIADLYNSGYLYPGDGAIAATQDDVNAAFANGQIAMMAEVSSNSQSTIETTGLTTIEIVSWPTMGTDELDYINGGSTGYFIPSNVEDPDFSVELLKTLTSQEVFSNAASNGSIVPVEIETTSDDPLINEYGKDADRVYQTEIFQLSAELNEYMLANLPANYLYYGDQAIEELEAMRLEAIGE